MSAPSPSLIAELWAARDLLRQFTVRQVELRHKGSHLGLAWSFLNPLLMLGLYVLVFGFVFAGRFKNGTGSETRVEYALVLFLGLAIHHFVAEVIATSPGVIYSNPNFVKKVVFPLAVLPAANLGAAFLHFLISLALVILGAVVCGVHLSLGTALWLPVILLPVLLAALGGALALSALGVFWRDIGQVTQFLTLALLFASAVFYPVNQIPALAWAWLKFNPLLLAIESARDAVFWGVSANPTHLAYLYACGVMICLAGATLFQRLRNSFADVL